MEEHRRLLDAADHLLMIGGRSRDRRRCKDVEFPDERPGGRATAPGGTIIYTLLETGMRRAEVTSIDLQTVEAEPLGSYQTARSWLQKIESEAPEALAFRLWDDLGCSRAV